MLIRSVTFEAQYARRSQWHRWFAWRPVRCAAGSVWLSAVWRRALPVSLEDHGGMVYDYRLVAP